MTLGLSYAASASWGPRLETPESLAKRALAMFKRLQAVDPVFASWYTWSKQDGIKALDLRLDRIAEEIAAGVMKSSLGSPQPCYGYHWEVHNSPNEAWGPRDFYASVSAGGDIQSLKNNVHVGTPYGFVAPDPSIVTFNIMRGAILALAETFEAAYAKAFPNTLSKLWPQGRGQPTLHIAWISYLAPRFAPLITPPPTAIVEYRPDGGLVMAAADETFNVENPAHIAAAQDIEKAVAPFNALPWPGDPRL